MFYLQPGLIRHNETEGPKVGPGISIGGVAAQNAGKLVRFILYGHRLTGNK
jgi:hypothetical protein